VGMCACVVDDDVCVYICACFVDGGVRVSVCVCVFYGYLTLSCIPVIQCDITDGSVSVCQARGGMHRGLKLSCSAVFISFDIFDYIFATKFARCPVVFVRTYSDD